MDEAALLAAICDFPEEVTPRLAYAGYLLEHPDQAKRDRGEFIALQGRLASGGVPPGEQYDLRKRERALLDQYLGTWVKPLEGVASGFAFHRGFPDHVTLDAVSFADLFGAIVAETPVVRVHLRGAGLESAAGSPDLARLAQLDLGRMTVTPDALRALLTSPHLTRLTYLNLGGNANGDALADALADSPVLKQLQFLGMANTRLTPSGVSRLLSALCRGGPLVMRWLNLRNNALASGNWAETVLAWLPPRTPACLRASLEAQLGCYRLTPLARDAGPLPRLKAAFKKLPLDFQFWVSLPEKLDRARLAAAIRTNPLPPEVHRAFAAVCTRRLEWWANRLNRAYREHDIKKDAPRLVAPANADTDRAALAELILLPDSGTLAPEIMAWFRDWLLRLYERHLAGTLDPEGRTR